MAVFDKIMDEKMDEAVKIAKQYVQDTLCGKVPSKSWSSPRAAAVQPIRQTRFPADGPGGEEADGLGRAVRARDEGLLDRDQLEESPQEAEPYVSGRIHRPARLPLLRGRIAQSLGRATEVFGWDDKSLMAGNQQMNLLNAAFCDTEERKPTPIEAAKKAEVKKTDKKLTLDDFF